MSESTAGLMPAAFFGHGSPMNALEVNRYTQSWQAFGQAVPRPRAILVISAHWYIHATAVTVMPKPRTIHDFFGFPQQLFDVEYPAPGLPELCEEISDTVHPTWVGADADSWGIDHGTWSVLTHAFPDADIPVVQLSINAMKGLDYHLQLGAQLAPLRRRGVLVVGSGNVVHNLGGASFQSANEGYDWAQRFNEDAKTAMLTEPTEVATLKGHKHFDDAVPTPDHFIPLLYLAGLAGASQDAGPERASESASASEPASGVGPAESTEVLVDGYAYGSISMTAYTLGMQVPALPTTSGATGEVAIGSQDSPALPADVPPDSANI
jgi:4,5-DOPA dioxygenase extradiol